jgi:hypothetical protein
MQGACVSVCYFPEEVTLIMVKSIMIYTLHHFTHIHMTDLGSNVVHIQTYMHASYMHACIHACMQRYIDT